MKTMVGVVVVGLVCTGGAARAQGQASNEGRSLSKSRQSRYQITMMERVLEGAVEHGATLTRDRLQAILPAQMLLSDNARVRGFRLEGYGVLFDVEVPSLEGTFPWSFRTLEQNDLGLDSALRALRSLVDSAGDPAVQQALKRIELQVAPMPGIVSPALGPASSAVPVASGDQRPDGPRGIGAAPPRAGDPIVDNPEEAYRGEIREALIDAMLEHSRGLELGPDEWLVLAVRRNVERPRLAAADSDATTMMIRLKGGDLNAFLGGQISREDARKRMDVRVF
jgi:hypothetical protein